MTALIITVSIASVILDKCTGFAFKIVLKTTGSTKIFSCKKQLYREKQTIALFSTNFKDLKSFNDTEEHINQI